MKRLTISVDDLASIRFLLNDSGFDPVQFAVLSEYAGAHGVYLTLTDAEKGIHDREAQLIKRVQRREINLQLRADPQSVKTALSINPSMITFVEMPDPQTNDIVPVDEAILQNSIAELIPDFHANSISVAVYCSPEIASLKQLGKLEIDYVQLDTREYTLASDSNEQLLAYDKLNTAALAATKLGIGVNLFGDIDYEHLSGLATIPRVEDICMGMSIVRRSMLVGIERAIREALDQILHYQQD